eukprot:1609608-Amphidinium_carterae.1
MVVVNIQTQFLSTSAVSLYEHVTFSSHPCGLDAVSTAVDRPMNGWCTAMSFAHSSHGVRLIVALGLLFSPLSWASQSDEHAEPGRNCLAVNDPMRGSADRSANKVVLGWKFWDSQQLVAKIAEIVLREMLGYDVSILSFTYRTDQWYLDLTEENVDVSLEQWYLVTTSPTYIKYVVTDRVVHHVSFLGYVGRSGLYTNQLA